MIASTIRLQAIDSAISSRISEVARLATDLMAITPGLTRTEALRVAERAVPHSKLA
jgi:hypothetical protein